MSNNASQLERLTFFSDAVFAIAITLLIIEVHVPHVGAIDDASYWQALGELRGSLLGFMLSFLVIGLLWMAHHRVFGLLHDYSPKIMWPNLLLLMTVAFMPFATALMSSNPRARVPELRVRVVNVVDLMRLEPDSVHPHGLSEGDFDALFTTDKPVIFAYHGYPSLIHRLTYRRTNHAGFHVRGYGEEGTTTTPFDMTVINGIDRFHLAADVLERVPGLLDRTGELHEWLRGKLVEHSLYIREHGEDLPEVREWTW